MCLIMRDYGMPGQLYICASVFPWVVKNGTYRSRALLGACSFISTGRNYALISEIYNDIPRIGSVLHLELWLFPLRAEVFFLKL